MCQLVGYIGDRPIAPFILKALELQEAYLGAHATGMGVIDLKGKIQVQKASGPVASVKKSTSIMNLKGNVGIGHISQVPINRGAFRHSEGRERPRLRQRD